MEVEEFWWFFKWHSVTKAFILFLLLSLLHICGVCVNNKIQLTSFIFTTVESVTWHILRNTQQNQIKILIKLLEVLKCHNDVSLSYFRKKGSNHSDFFLFFLKHREKANLSFITFVKLSFCVSVILSRILYWTF